MLHAIRGSAIAAGCLAWSVLAVSGPAAADNQVSVGVTAGALSAGVNDLSLPAVTFDFSPQTTSGVMTLNAADRRGGSGAGWNVTVQASAFAYSGPNGGTSIPAAQFTATSNGAPVHVKGQSGANMPTAVSGSTGPLNTARKTLQASAGNGKGVYTQPIAVTLTVPAESAPGTYTSTLTVTIASGP